MILPPFAVVDEVTSMMLLDWFTEQGREIYGRDLIQKSLQSPFSTIWNGVRHSETIRPGPRTTTIFHFASPRLKTLSRRNNTNLSESSTLTYKGIHCSATVKTVTAIHRSPRWHGMVGGSGSWARFTPNPHHLSRRRVIDFNGNVRIRTIALRYDYSPH